MTHRTYAVGCRFTGGNCYREDCWGGANGCAAQTADECGDYEAAERKRLQAALIEIADTAHIVRYDENLSAVWVEKKARAALNGSTGGQMPNVGSRSPTENAVAPGSQPEGGGVGLDVTAGETAPHCKRCGGEGTIGAIYADEPNHREPCPECHHEDS